MKQIDPQALLKHITPQRLAYSQEYIDLSQPEKIAQWAMKCYANDNETCFAVTWKYPDWNVVSFINSDDDFCRQFLRQFDQTEVCLPLRPGQAPPNIKLRGLRQKAIEQAFAYEGPAPQRPIDPHIRLLNHHELDLLLPLVRDPIELKTPGMIAFTWHENETIAGFLHCNPDVADLWDVGFIHTLPEHQGRGIGTALAYAYLKTMCERGLVPYYSGVSNPASAAAARKAGFELCCARHVFNYKRPKLFK